MTTQLNNNTTNCNPARNIKLRIRFLFKGFPISFLKPRGPTALRILPLASY